MSKVAKKVTKVTNRAVRKHFSDTVVTFVKGKDMFGSPMYKIRFKNGEVSTISPARFEELYKVIV